jgi:uncharacterized protein (DUF1800 family)
MLYSPIFNAKRRHVRFLSCLCLFLFAGIGVANARIIDLNHNGMSDIWEWIYNAYGVDPNADPDGDHFSNLQESIAGTNPFDSNSYPDITVMTATSNVFSVTVPCELGKQYQLQGSPTVVGTNWVVEATIVARTGTNVTLVAPTNATARYFRLAISDVDTDGDGLSDWESYQLGLDPFNPFSNGHQDANGNPLSDYAYVSNMLTSQNVISIAATVAAATQPDPGQNSTLTGQFTITRGGFPLDSIMINLGLGGPGVGYATPGVDYAGLPSSIVLEAGVSSETLRLTPLADTNLTTPVLAQLQLLTGLDYTVDTQSNASVVIYPSPTPSGTGLLGQYYTNSSVTYTNSENFNPTNLILTRIDPQVDFLWSNGMSPNLSNGLYTVRWTGQVQPTTSDLYYFDVASDDGCRLWVNDQLLIDKWEPQWVTDWTNAIELQAGVRYDIRLDYFQDGGWAQAHLYWYNSTQAREIIPSTSLYPSNSVGTNGSNGPAVVTSAMNAFAFLGQPFTFTVTAANTPLGFTAIGLPPGLNFNTTNGVIAGVPTLAGNFQVTLTASNLIGVGASVVNIAVLDTGSSVVQEIWTNVTGSYVTNIPTGKPANITNVLGSLAGVVNYGNNYAERVRGYFTAPTTGNYYFWIAGSDSAQLWISNDGDQVNRVLRSWVTPTNNPTKPGEKGTTNQQWNLQASQRSPWLSLVGGQSYYIEILHKAGVGVGDNWSVGWAQDPTGTNYTVTGVVPSYLLARYYPPLPSSTPGTLYSANMLALPGVTSDGVGSATLRVNAAGTQATLNFSVNNLTSAPTGQAINSDPYLNDPAELIFDIAAAKPQPDGSYLWNFKATGPLAVSDILEIISEGKAAIVIESSAFPNGEIGGNFTLANGSETFTPPPTPPVWENDSAESNAAVRFLNQATFGASASDIASVRALGYSRWLTDQFALPTTHFLTNVLATQNPDPTDPFPSQLWFNTWWRQAVTAPDQLRQRVAFALSEIFVVSENGTLTDHADALSSYYDMLLNNAFGNYSNLLADVTLHPSMGLYLSMQGNNAGSIITGIHADENYAREVQQLFSIGLNREWPDGTLILNSQDSLVPTYNQNVIMGFASVFTGWNFYQTNSVKGRLPSNWYPPANYTNPMVLVSSHHELGSKLLLDNVVLPQAWGYQRVPSTTNDAYCAKDLESALNAIFNNQNVAPFISRQLIQRLVTSNPSRDYVYRVAQVFNDDGTGTRGNLKAVVQAILLDYEARSSNMVSQPTYGKQREPLLRITAVARAFPPSAGLNGSYSETTNQLITVTTPTPHRLGNGDTVWLKFTDASGHPAPTTQAYNVTTTGTKSFTVIAPQVSAGSYNETNGIITANISGNGLAVGNPVYLDFTSGGALSGLFQIATVVDGAHFTVTNADKASHAGNCLMPKLNVGGCTQVGTSVTVITIDPHGLKPGNEVFINFGSGPDASGIYKVASAPSTTHFTITSTNSVNQVQDGLSVYPLIPAPLPRHGSVAIDQDTWNMGYTDSGSSSSLSQSPLRSPTVFNFFYPTFEFPGALASAGLTTPEFQLTSATSVGEQMNFAESGILNNTGNTNGLSSFSGGAIVLDLGPWMTTKLTADSGVPNLVSALSTRLVAGQLSPSATTSIVDYVANTNNFGYSTPPTDTQMRDRVRAVVHLITSSPDFIIQK